MLPNRVDAALSESDVQKALSSIAQIEKELNFLLTLTPSERQALPKMGDRSYSFVQKGLEVGTQHTELTPRYFNPAAMQKDVALHQQLSRINLALSRLRQKVQDTMHVAGSEAYIGALTVYKSLQDLPASAGLEEVKREMSQRFTRSAQPDNTETPDEGNTES